MSNSSFSQRSPQIRQADVVIVGAGLAGLMAARYLHKAGLSVVVLEARDRVGGRTYTVTRSDGSVFDRGGQWLGPNQHHVRALAEELGVQTFDTYDTGENIKYRQGQCYRYAGGLPTSDPLVTMETVEALLSLNLLAQEVPLDAAWTAPRAAEWDALTVAAWLEANVPEKGARDWLTLVVQGIFACEPHNLSFLHFLFYVHSAGSLNALIGVKRSAQESLFAGGAQQLSIRMAQALGDRVILEAPVHSIVQDEQGVRVESETAAVTAQHAIIALPPTLAGRLRYLPQLPALRDQFTQRVPMGTVIKVICFYETPFWREAGLTGQVLSDRGPLRFTFDCSPASGTPGILIGFIEADDARIWGQRSLEERRAAVLDCLSRYFGEQAGQPSDYIEQSWAEEEYTRGCYAAYMPPGVLTIYGEALRTPIGRLHWAGTETATVWNGYMDGALQSGIRAASEILQALGKADPQESKETQRRNG